MKRAMFSLLPLVLGVAILGANWKLDHPPVSSGDLLVRGLMARADHVELSAFSCQQSACSANVLLKASLNVGAREELLQALRSVDSNGPSNSGGFPVEADVIFEKQHKLLGRLSLSRSGATTTVTDQTKRFALRVLPRFERPLWHFVGTRLRVAEPFELSSL